MQKLKYLIQTSLFLFLTLLHSLSAGAESLYEGFSDANKLADEYQKAELRLREAIKQPEYMLKNWVNLPIAPDDKSHQRLNLSMQEAILLALRYNPDIQNAELDRIIQRYQLRQAYNEFELQFALAGSANFERNHFSDVGSSNSHSLLATPEVSLKTKLGTRLALRMDNNVATYDSYNPVLNFSITQPLLRGFGSKVNEVSLKNAIDREFLNQLNLKQSIINQVTSVITAYRSMILSAKNLEIQKIQLKEAKRLYEMNEKKIDAGQLEPTGNIQQAYQIESLNLTLEQATNDFQNSAQTLLQVIGLDPQMKLAVPSDIDLKNLLVPDMKASIQTALAHNADYQAVKLAYKADQRAYEVAKNEQLWDLNVSGNVQTGDMANVDGLGGFLGIYQGKNINQSVRLTLKIPIRDLDQRAKLINAKTQLEKDRVRLTATKRALITEVRNLIHTIASQAKRYQLAVKQVKMAKQSFELQKKRQDAGISTALDVTNTQNQLIQAQLGLMNAKIAYLNQMSTLQRLLGTTLEAWHIKLRNGQ